MHAYKTYLVCSVVNTTAALCGAQVSSAYKQTTEEALLHVLDAFGIYFEQYKNSS